MKGWQLGHLDSTRTNSIGNIEPIKITNSWDFSFKDMLITFKNIMMGE